MKEESKELIDWIKKQISLAGTIVTDVSQLCWQQDRDKAIKFLDSLPEIESHLCNGGYIQDKNGTPCCHGDNVKCVLSEYPREDWFYGKLMWNAANGAFEIYTNTNTYSITLMSYFEKVEK